MKIWIIRREEKKLVVRSRDFPDDMPIDKIIGIPKVVLALLRDVGFGWSTGAGGYVYSDDDGRILIGRNHYGLLKEARRRANQAAESEAVFVKDLKAVAEDADKKLEALKKRKEYAQMVLDEASGELY